MPSYGVVAAKYRRKGSGQATLIDGLPVVITPGTLRYVDGGLGTGGDGLTWEAARTTIQATVTAAARGDFCFIRPLAAGAYYTESVVVPNTTRELSLIGLTGTKGGSVYQAVTWRNSSNSVDDSALDLRPAHCQVENIHFFSRAAQELGFGIKAYWNTGSGLNIGSAIVNCGFSADLADHPAAAGLVQSAIRFDSSEGQLVENCFFTDCRVGIAAGSTMNASKELWVVNCHFNGLAANIAADLFLSDITNLHVTGCVFGHTVPSHAAGTMQKYIFTIGGTTTTGSVTNCHFGSANAGYGTDNTDDFIRAGNTYSAGMMTS